MPTPPPVATYQWVFRRVTKYLGIFDTNYPEGDEIISTSPYTKDLLKKQIVQSDIEMCALIASVIDNPYRNKFFSETPTTLANGDRIPAYIGVHGGVEVQISGTWYQGRLAQSLDHLQRTRDKLALGATRILPNSKQLYYIENGQLELVSSGYSGRVYVPTIPVGNEADSAPTLSTPRVYAFGLVGHTIANARPVGAEMTHRNNWMEIWAGYARMILNGEASLPEPERLQRIAA